MTDKTTDVVSSSANTPNADASIPSVSAADQILAGGRRPIHEYNVMAPMRDGVLLATDVIRPDVERPCPVILARTCYDKVTYREHFKSLFAELLDRGYAIAVQDCRGRSNSDGEFTMYMDETRDGFDAVEWLGELAWCDGSVGMIGASYDGQTQWFAAAEAPKHLRAIVPLCSPPGNLWLNEPILNGAMQLGALLEWMWKMGRHTFSVENFAENILTGEEFPFVQVLPISDAPQAGGFESRNWKLWMEHPTYDEFWEGGEYERFFSQMTVPALNITGWWDMALPGALANYRRMRDEGASTEAREGARLIIGPWSHALNGSSEANGVDFGPQAILDLDRLMIRFYDQWIKGEDQVALAKPVYVFVIGADEWWAEDDWPLPDAVATNYYLHSDGAANSLKGDGRLSLHEPSDETPDHYRYDPSDPVHVPWQMYDGPVDDRAASSRDDVLCYTTEELTEATDVVGPVTLALHAASSARDTDWFARLIDVHPDGSARFLSHGVVRARFRESHREPRLLTPGEPCCYQIDMDAVGVRLMPGHRIRLEITSSWFPRYDRNTNSGADNQFTDAAIVVADQTVLHDAVRPSHLVLPIVKRSSV